MQQTSTLCVVTLLMLISVDLGAGLKCYQCRLLDGVGDEGCDENPPPEKYLRECAQPQCWMKYSNNGTAHYERFCVAVASSMNGCMAVNVFDSKGTQHSGLECKCNDPDGCNGNKPAGVSDSTGSSSGGSDSDATSPAPEPEPESS